jgi:hypothetical protein
VGEIYQLPDGNYEVRALDADGNAGKFVIDERTYRLLLESGHVKPNNRVGPGPIANTIGIIVPKTSPGLSGNSAPTPTPAPKEEGWWSRWGSGVTHGVLDVVGLIPVAGEVANLVGAGVYMLEGDKVSAALDLAAMWPAGGQAATAAKYGVKGGEAAAKQLEKKAAREAAEAAERKAAKEAEEAAAKKAEKEGGHVKGDPRCVLRPYKPDTCKPNRTGHHVVPDRVFRAGARGSARINGGVPENDGLVICVEGSNLSRSREHGQIHALYDPVEAAAGLLGNPPGTAKLGVLEAAGAIATAKITGCNALLLEAQLRAYHQSKGLGFDTIVRADPTGKLPINPANVGVGAVPPGGATR